MHLTLDHLDKAEAAWRAVVCGPDDPFLNLRLGECLVRRALECRNPAQRRLGFTEAAQCLESAGQLFNLEAASHDGRGQKRYCDQGRAHFWLGRARFELDDYEAAIRSLGLSCALDYEPLPARLRLGVARLRAGSLSEGERELERVRRDAEPMMHPTAEPTG